MSKDTSDKDCCGLCGGTGEVQITPYGQADSHADVFGCPACIQADRDEAERERDQLQQQLEEERAAWSAKRSELLRNHAAELVRRKTAEVQRNELAEALELCMAAVKLAGWEGDFCMDKARAALQSIKEQTK